LFNLSRAQHNNETKVKTLHISIYFANYGNLSLDDVTREHDDSFIIYASITRSSNGC